MKIAVVTGASSGMGREFVYSIDKSYKLDEIWVIARREDRLNELKAQCSTPVRPIPLDLLDKNSFSVYRSLLEEVKPEIEFLVNAAGFGLFGSFADMDLDRQLDSISLNANALTAFCHISIPYMSQDSHIINLASNSSWQPVPYINVYGASKAYVMSFSRALGVELKNKKIHVMAVAPGWIKTEFFDHAIHDDTIKYFDRYYTAEQVIVKAMKDLKKNKTVSILGFPVRMQVLAIKFLPIKLVIKIWCKQQGK
ncbi:MAG: SDR family NAD(P)-dependent oxidoreductase [Oscillospiraceae bacterium]|nr:SDR family NAD(P)-dependent oxidoreductase [Oscillospiraceae bacterium]